MFFFKFQVCTDILALIFLLPSSAKYLKPSRSWDNYSSAFFYSNVQMYILNVFFGISVLVMVAMTVERFIRIRRSYLHPLNKSGDHRRACIISSLLVIFSFVVYIPYSFSNNVSCFTNESGNIKFTHCQNTKVTSTKLWRTYIWAKQVIFRFGPVLIIAALNIIIWTNYSDIMARRRKLKGFTVTPECREESRLKRMLTSLSLMFLICITPSAILSGIISDKLQQNLGFQIFRAVANYLEICFFSFSFYTLCLSSPQFRNLFMTMVRSATGNNNRLHSFCFGNDNQDEDEYQNNNMSAKYRNTEVTNSNIELQLEPYDGSSSKRNIFTIELSASGHINPNFLSPVPPGNTTSEDYSNSECNETVENKVTKL